MIRGILIIVTTAVIASTSVQAQGFGTLKAKSPNKASDLSLGGTLLPIVAGAAVLSRDPGGVVQVGGITSLLFGIIAGPSLGHAYACNGKRCLFGIGFRTVMVGSTLAVIFGSDGGGIGPDGGDMAVLSNVFVLVAVSTIWDIAAVPRSVRAYNQKHGLESLSLAPTYDPVKNQVGLRVRLSI